MLRGVVAQRLLPRVDGGRVAVVELMITNARIADLIREEQPEEITDAIGEGEYFGMQTFQRALIDAVIAGDVEGEVAANAASSRHDFLVALERELKHQAAGATDTTGPMEGTEDPAALEPEVAKPAGLRIAPAAVS